MKYAFRVAAAFAILSVACGGSPSPPAPAGPSDATTDAPSTGDDGKDTGAADASGVVDATAGDGAPTTDDAASDAASEAATGATPGDASAGDAASRDASVEAAAEASIDAATFDAALDAPAEASEASASPGLPLGSTCTTGGDCASAFCIPVVPGSPSVCVTSCTQQSDCATAPGFFCDPLVAGSSQGYCVAHSPEHCATCATDADCGALSESCFAAPGDSALACHVDCSLSEADACPPDYTCTNETVKGVSRKLCRPTLVPDCVDAQGGYCDNVTTPQPCTRTNTAGACTAQRGCSATQRFQACAASPPSCKTDCSVQDPAGCTEIYCAAATETVTNCGGCGTICPGYMQTGDNVTCQSGGTCTFSCQGENYDVDGAAVNGCEAADAPTGNHTSSTAADLGSLSCDDTAVIMNASGTILSDKRVHESPSVVGFDAASGSAPDWFQIKGTGGTFCTSDVVVTLTVQGSSSPACYHLTVITDKYTYSVPTDATGTAAINKTSGQYSDNSEIKFEVQKTCGTSVTESATYAITGHL